MTLFNKEASGLAKIFRGVFLLVIVWFFLQGGIALAASSEQISELQSGRTCGNLSTPLDCSQCVNPTPLNDGGTINLNLTSIQMADCISYGNGYFVYPDGDCTPGWENCFYHSRDCSCNSPATCGEVAGVYSCFVPLTASCTVRWSDTDGNGYVSAATWGAPVEDGDVVTWEATASGGAGSDSYVFNWSGTDALQGLLGYVQTIRYYTTGVKTGSVTVSKGAQTIVVNACVPPSVTVVAPISLVSFKAISASCPTGLVCYPYYLDETVVWQIEVSGGAGDGTFTFDWSGDLERAPFSGVSQSTGVIKYNSVGLKKVTVVARSGGSSKSFEKEIEVVERPVVIDCIPPTNPTVNLGQRVNFSSSGRNGSGSFNINWDRSDGGGGVSYPVVSTLTSQFSATFDTLGEKIVRVTAQSLDASGNPTLSEDESECRVNVVMPVYSVSCSMSPSNGQIIPGGSVQFTAVPSGGTGNFTYTDYGWDIAGPVSGSSDERTFTHPFPIAGTYTVNLSSFHNNASGDLLDDASCSPMTVTVATPPPPPPRCGDGVPNSTETPDTCCIDFQPQCTATGAKCLPQGTGSDGQPIYRCVSPNEERPPYVPPTPGEIPNPLGDITDIPGLFAELSNLLVKFLTPLIVLFFVISGLMFITARGNPAKLETAKKALLYTAIGAGVILGAWAFANMIKEVLGG